MAKKAAMQYVIHIGVHKTGTTLLQKNLCANQEHIQAQGVWCLNAENPFLQKMQLQCLRRFQQNIYDEAQEHRFERNIQKMRRRARNKDAHTILMSEENYLGAAIHRQLSWGQRPAQFYPQAAECLRQLTVGIPDSSLKFVLYQRDPFQVLRGQYTEALRALRLSCGFKDFLDQVDLQSFRFDHLVERLRADRPDAEFVVRSFARMKEGPEGFVRDFYASCGLDPASLNVEISLERPSVDRHQAERLRQIAQACGCAPKRHAKHQAWKVAQDPPNKSAPLLSPPEYVDAFEALRQEDTIGSEFAEPLTA